MKGKRIFVLITIMLMLVFLVTGCNLFTPPVTKNYIKGRVLMPPTAKVMSKDITGWVPAANAQVTIVDANGKTHTVTTDSNGNYRFENIEVNANTVITATITIDGKKLVLKGVIPQRVAENENHDVGTMDTESTALALVVEHLLDSGVNPADIDLDAIKGSDSFSDLLDKVTSTIEGHGNVTQDPVIAGLVGDVEEEVNPSEPEPPPGGDGGTAIQVSAISVEGDAIVGETLTANPSPSGATVTYQWMRSNTSGGSYSNIPGATGQKYNLIAIDAGKYIKVAVTGTDKYTGTKTSDAVGPVVNEIAHFVNMNNPGIHNNIIYEGFELQDSKNNKIPLDEDSINSIIVQNPNGTTTTLIADSDTLLWFNVRKAGGDYKYIVETKDDKFYSAILTWTETTKLDVIKQSDEAVKCGDGVYRYHYIIGIPLKVEDTLIYRIKPTGNIDQQTINDDSDYFSIYFRYTDEGFTQLEGDHIYIIKKDGIWYEAVITYNEAEITLIPVTNEPDIFTMKADAGSYDTIKVMGKIELTQGSKDDFDLYIWEEEEWVECTFEDNDNSYYWFGPQENDVLKGIPFADIPDTRFKITFNKTGELKFVIKILARKDHINQPNDFDLLLLTDTYVVTIEE